MQASQQRDEVELLAAGDDEFAVEHELVLRQRQQRLDDLGEVACEWPLVAAAQVDLAAIAEHQAAEAVPLRLVEVVAPRQFARQARQHRADKERHWQHTREVSAQLPGENVTPPAACRCRAPFGLPIVPPSGASFLVTVGSGPSSTPRAEGPVSIGW